MIALIALVCAVVLRRQAVRHVPVERHDRHADPAGRLRARDGRLHQAGLRRHEDADVPTWEIVIPLAGAGHARLHALPQRVPLPDRGAGPVVPGGGVRLAAPGRRWWRSPSPASPSVSAGGLREPRPRRSEGESEVVVADGLRPAARAISSTTTATASSPPTSTAPAFEALMNEADRAPRRSARPCSTRCSGWRSAGTARRCSTCEPLAPPDDYLARRRELGGRPRSTGGCSRPPASRTFLVDTGLTPERSARPAELAGLAVRRHGRRGRPAGAVAEDGAGRRAAADFAGEVEAGCAPRGGRRGRGQEHRGLPRRARLPRHQAVG